ncbi:MAG: PqqD family peptide modification chaperone [bacterium]
MNKQYSINLRVGWRYIDSEIVTFNCANQEIAIWNETASFLWKKIYEGATNLDDLVRLFADEYSIDKKMAKRDITVFLQEAVSLDFINYPDNKLELKSKDQNDDGGENVLLAIEMKAIEKFIPFAITFETTYSCNEKCVHCYMDRNKHSLSFNEVKRILDEIAAEGCLFVSFTGGEFFTRDDAMEIVEYADKLHFVVDILSNGTLVTEDKANMLALRSVRRVQVSLYGATPETHDSITRLSGSFKKTLQGINFLTKAGIKVEIAFPLMQINFHERYLLKDLAKSLGCLMSPSHVITARNSGEQDTFSFRLNDEQLKLFLEDKDLSSLYAGRKPFQDHQFYFGFSDLTSAAPCYSGFNSCAITPSGEVLPCNQLLYKVGDLREKNFSGIWNNSPQIKHLRNLTIGNLPICSSCPTLSFCARCPGLALLEGGDLLGPSPENCRITTTFVSGKGGEIHEKEKLHSASR